MMGWRRDLIGLIAVGGFVSVGVLLLLGTVIDVTMKEVGLVVIGQLSMKFGTVVDYHYGSSAGSAMKDQAAVDVARAASVTVKDTAKAAAVAVTDTAKAVAKKAP